MSWRRLVRDAQDFEKEDDGHYVEIVRVGSALYERSGRSGAEQQSLSRRVLASEASAQKSLEKKIASLRGDGYAEDDPVDRPIPAMTNTKEHREATHARGRELFEALLPRFAIAYREAGHDPTKDFVSDCIGKNTQPNAIARECLGVAGAVFRAGFTYWTYTYDQEHGTRMTVPEHALASFYGRPAHVVALAREKLCGRNEKHDDLDAPGLADEIALRFVALAKAGS